MEMTDCALPQPSNTATHKIFKIPCRSWLIQRGRIILSKLIILFHQLTKKHLSYKNQIFITVFEIGIHSTYPEPDESQHFALFQRYVLILLVLSIYYEVLQVIRFLSGFTITIHYALFIDLVPADLIYNAHNICYFLKYNNRRAETCRSCEGP